MPGLPRDKRREERAKGLKKPPLPKRILVPATRLSTCRHEAAHAVIAELLGMPVVRIDVFDDHSGLVTFDQRHRIGKAGQALIAFAGSAAEQLWHGMPFEYVSTADLALVRSHFSVQDQNLLNILSQRLVREHRRSIFRVARVLLSTPKLSGRELRRLLEAPAQRRLSGFQRTGWPGQSTRRAP